MLSLAAVVGHHGLCEWCPRELGPIAWDTCLVSLPAAVCFVCRSTNGQAGGWRGLGGPGRIWFFHSPVSCCGPCLAGSHFILEQRTQLSQSRGNSQASRHHSWLVSIKGPFFTRHFPVSLSDVPDWTWACLFLVGPSWRSQQITNTFHHPLSLLY